MNMQERFGFNPVAGEVGIEIEMEGRQLPFRGDGVYWVAHNDPSLRGAGAGTTCEYVLIGAIPRETVRPALLSLETTLRDYGAVLKPSQRAGIHVHINCLPNTFEQVMAFAMLYSVFERAMVQFCGPDRSGNMFCLRIADAEALIPALINCVKIKDFHPVCHDVYRYCSLNLGALAKHGSVEFRALRSQADFVDLTCNWVDLILCIKDASAAYLHLPNLAAAISQQGPLQFAQSVFGPLLPLIATPQLENDIMETLRLLQPIIFTKAGVEKGKVGKAAKVRMEVEDFPQEFFDEPQPAPVGWVVQPDGWVVPPAPPVRRR